MRSLRILTGLLILAFIAAVTGSTVTAQTSDGRYFPQTGFTVRGEFLRFFNGAPKPLEQIGYPISEEMISGNLRVQYFTHVRMEMALNDPNAKVALTNLGILLHGDKVVPADVPTNSPTCRIFPKNGFSVCYKFLSFYDANNGPVYLGEPISNAEIVNGRTVQYFEFGRLEWRPNLPADQQVAVSDLGVMALARFVGTVKRPGPSIIGSQAADNLVIHANAFVEQALVPVNTPNRVFVVVQDQYMHPVAGAKVNITINLSDGKRDYFTQVTDADGIARVTVPGLDLPLKEMVRIEASVEYNKQTVTARTWYRVWY